MNAYDLHILARPYDPEVEDHHGWVMGAPPGIESRHWPIDPNSGYPLMHGFTIRLPEDHRVHGEEIVGLSFFAIAPDHCDGMPTSGLVIPDLLRDHPDQPPTDKELARIWSHAREEHPRLHRMRDILECEYAVILLTEAEFSGPRCAVPEWVEGSALAGVPRPSWLDRGDPSNQPSSKFVVNALHGDPRTDSRTDSRTDPRTEAGFDRAIRWEARADDPNAGIKVEEFPGSESRYTSPLDPETYELRPWAAKHLPNHIGGTMMPVQGVPDVSPHYIEFSEVFGDYNFGGGNAQLDFLNMKFDWACG